MNALDQLALGMGTAWTAGINLYATVAALGTAQAAGWVELPPGLQVLANPLVITVAIVMYVIEFVADKVPYVDTGWDALHTFIRVPAGALLAARALGPQNPALEVAAALAGGTVALAAHGTKATARLAINASPEPFTNWIASFTEDIVAFAGVWAAIHHPILMLFLVIGFMALAIYLVPKIFRALLALFRRATGGGGVPASPAAPPASA